MASLSLKQAWDRVAAAQVSAWPLARTRMIVGTLAFARAIVGAPVLFRATDPATLRLPYIAGLPVLSRAEVPWLVGLWLLAATAFTAGWRTRWSGIVLAVVLARILTADQQTYSSHLYLLLLLVVILSFGDSGAVGSLDARSGVRREVVPGWPVWLLAAQGSIVYGFAALAKLIPEYLSGAMLCADFGWMSANPPVLLCAGLAMGSIVTELFLAVALWQKRWFRFACVVGVGLHVAMIVMLAPAVRWQLIIFAGEMLVLYPLYPLARAMAVRESPG